MAIFIELEAGLRHLVGSERLSVEPKGGSMTIAELLLELVAAHPRFAAAIVEHDGELDLALLVAIDARMVHRRDYASRRIADGDVVELHMALVGG